MSLENRDAHVQARAVWFFRVKTKQKQNISSYGRISISFEQIKIRSDELINGSNKLVNLYF